MKKVIITLSIIAVILLIVFLIPLLQKEDAIGGQGDEHGCLGPAGYSWNEEEQECVREWETGEARYQVTNFQTCKDAGYPIMESYPQQCNTPSGRNFVEELPD